MTDAVQPLRLSSPRIALRPVTPADVAFLYSLVVDKETSVRWRHRGMIPPMDVFVSQLWSDVAVQFVAWSRSDESRVGHVAIYGLDERDQVAMLAVATADSRRGSGLDAEAAFAMASYAFQIWPLVRLYMEVPEYNMDQMNAAVDRGILRLEATVRDRYYLDGRRWDLHILGLDRGGLAQISNDAKGHTISGNDPMTA